MQKINDRHKLNKEFIYLGRTPRFSRTNKNLVIGAYYEPVPFSSYTYNILASPFRASN